MVRVQLATHADVGEWRTQARDLLHRNISPELVTWCGPDADSILAGVELSAVAGRAPVPAPATLKRVPREFLALVERVIAHRDTQRFALLYRILWRLSREEPRLLALLTDADVQRARVMAQAVKRDAHKMKAFVRFREDRKSVV